MKQAIALRNYVLLHDDGRIHYPFTKYLTDQFSNPHTQELAAQSLRVLYRFCNAHQIELSLRAIDGRCLTYNETKELADLCYRPLTEIEAMSTKKIIFLTSPQSGKAPKGLPGAVTPNSAKKRLNQIAGYLDFYMKVFLLPNIRSESIRNKITIEYETTINKLNKSIKGTKQNHHLAIKSLPTEKYLSIIEAVFVRPEECFQTNSGKPSRTLYRDRAMALLSCEGLRPGTLGNISMADFQPISGHLTIQDNRAKRSERITTNTPKLKLGDSTQVNSASETLISLWPSTAQAIQEYIDGERSAVLRKRMTNRSAGFLFLSEGGNPIKHRGSITEMFAKLGRRLATQGLLDVADDPYFPNQKKYDFYGYVLRHSAASFFLTEKCREISHNQNKAPPRDFKDVPDRIKDQMKLRFGWTAKSNMPEIYAARALSVAANITLMYFHQGLLDAAQKRKIASGILNDS